MQDGTVPVLFRIENTKHRHHSTRRNSHSGGRTVDWKNVARNEHHNGVAHRRELRMAKHRGIDLKSTATLIRKQGQPPRRRASVGTKNILIDLGWTAKRPRVIRSGASKRAKLLSRTPSHAREHGLATMDANARKMRQARKDKRFAERRGMTVNTDTPLPTTAVSWLPNDNDGEKENTRRASQQKAMDRASARKARKAKSKIRSQLPLLDPTKIRSQMPVLDPARSQLQLPLYDPTNTAIHGHALKQRFSKDARVVKTAGNEFDEINKQFPTTGPKWFPFSISGKVSASRCYVTNSPDYRSDVPKPCQCRALY